MTIDININNILNRSFFIFFILIIMKEDKLVYKLRISTHPSFLNILATI